MRSHYKVGCDAHRHCSLLSVFDSQGRAIQNCRVDHDRGANRTFHSQFPPGTPVTLETVGNWHWIADKIEEAGCVPLPTHAARAKVMMGYIHKTDKLDADGLATLLHNGTLPAATMDPLRSVN